MPPPIFVVVAGHTTLWRASGVFFRPSVLRDNESGGERGKGNFKIGLVFWEEETVC